MRPEIFDFIGNLDTLLAVVLGAVLATLGGLTANWIEERRQRKRREKDAARFFGEVLASIDLIVFGASESRKIGEPYGPITMRMLKGARREIEVYERNRERLFDLSDPALRARIHIAVLRLSLPIDSALEAHDEILRLQDQLAPNRDTDPTNDLRADARAAIDARIASNSGSRAFAF